MKLENLFKSGLAVVFACTLTFATIGCDGGGSGGGGTPVTPTDGGDMGEPAEGGSEPGAGDAVPE